MNAEPIKTADDVCRDVAQRYGMTSEELKSNKVKRHWQKARVEFYKILFDQYGYTYQAIADYMGRSTHSTIYYAIHGRHARNKQ